MKKSEKKHRRNSFRRIEECGVQGEPIGLQKPEFIGGEVDLRINIYRGQIDVTVDLNNAIKVPDTIDEIM